MATLMSYREDGRCTAGCEGEIGRYRRARSSGRSDHRAPHSRQMTRRGEETCEMLRKDWQTGQQGVGMSGTSSSGSGLPVMNGRLGGTFPPVRDPFDRASSVAAGGMGRLRALGLSPA